MLFPRDVMSTFAQTPHTPHCLQQQIHQTLQLTHTPPSVLSLQLYLYLPKKHREKQKKQVLMKAKCLDHQQLFLLILPHQTALFYHPSSTFLKVEMTLTGRAQLSKCPITLEKRKPPNNQRNSLCGAGESRASLHSQCHFIFGS